MVTGIVSALVYPKTQSYALSSRVGIGGAWAVLALYGTAALDLLPGLATLTRRWVCAALIGQLLVMVLFTFLITVCLREFWVHPFGPVTKNLPLAVATVCALVMERCVRWST